TLVRLVRRGARFPDGALHAHVRCPGADRSGGDFTSEESEALRDAAFTAVSIGHARLRTETAALAACTWMSLVQQRQLRTMLTRLAILLALGTWAHGHMGTYAQGSFQLAVLKYGGGGDWYANPTAMPNLVAFCNQQLGTGIDPDVPVVDVG